MTIDKWDNYMLGKTDQDPFFSFIQKDALLVDGSKIEMCRSYHHFLSSEAFFFIPYQGISNANLGMRMKEFLEDARIRVRQVREEARELILKMEKEKTVSEDEKFKLFDEIDKMTKEYQDQIERMGDGKEEEIMTV